MVMKREHVPRTLLALCLTAVLACMPAFAVQKGQTPAGGQTQAQSPSDVAGVVEQTWQDAAQQIRTVVDSVVFPALSMILAVAFFGKVALCYFEYRRGGHFEWTGPVILFVCLVFVLLAPNYVWTIIGL